MNNNLPVFYGLRASDQNSDIGPRNAAVLTFSGNTNDSMIKELTQNSLDARASANGKLKIRIRLEEINKKEIPDFDNFENILEDMTAYYRKRGTQYDEFFSQAKKSIAQDKIRVFIFEDFNTKGLQGDDKSLGSFKSCVNDDNISSKGSSDSLGNHGIGKNSVFGYSGIHTVFYSSLNQNNEYKFKGVSKLGTYKDAENVHRSEKIYYGRPSKNENGTEEVLLIDKRDSIPEFFRRTEVGLSQFVIAADTDLDWKDNVLKAFITNYWFLFEQNMLEVQVDDVVIAGDNYFDEANRIFKSDTSKDNPIPFICSFRDNNPTECKIDNLGTVRLYLKEAEESEYYPNKIEFLRDGMKIKHESLGIGGLPARIAGVIFCIDKIGNEILGAMEPHAHNDFQADLVEKKGAPNNIDKKKAKKILSDIKDFWKQEIRNIKDRYSQSVESVDFIDELFNSLFQGNSGGHGISGELSDIESFERKNTNIDFKGLFSSFSKAGIKDSDGTSTIDDGEGPEAGEGSDGKGLRSGNSKKGSEGGGGIRKEGPRSTKNRKNISARFFLAERLNEINIYQLVLKSDQLTDKCTVVIGQHGDSGGKGIMGSEMLKAEFNGTSVAFKARYNSDNYVTGYELHNLTIGAKTILKLEFLEKHPSAFKIIETI